MMWSNFFHIFKSGYNHFYVFFPVLATLESLYLPLLFSSTAGNHADSRSTVVPMIPGKMGLLWLLVVWSLVLIYTN